MPTPNIVFWNCNSLSHEKFDRMELLYASDLYENDGVLAVCCIETKHHPQPLPRSSGTRELPSYVSYRKPFAENSGGIAVFLKQSVSAAHRPDLEASPHCLILECKMPGAPGPCLLSVCYRRQAEGKQGWLSLKTSLKRALATNLPLIAVGDFNAHAKDFGDPRNCSFGLDLVNFCDDQGLTALNPIFCAGRLTRKNAVLDLALVSSEASVTDMEVGGKFGLLSDHASLGIRLSAVNIVKEKRRNFERWNYSAADWHLFKSLLHLRASSALEQCQSDVQRYADKQAVINLMEQCLQDTFNFCAEKAVGKKSISARKTWWEIDPQLQPLFKSFNSAKRQDFRLQTEESKAAADTAFQEWQSKLTAVKTAFWEKECQRIAGNGQVNWSAFKETHKPGTFPLNCIRDARGNLPSSNQDALNSLAKHFADVCTQPEIKRMSPAQEECKKSVEETIVKAADSKSAIDSPFTLQEVLDAIADIKRPKSAAGPDSIPAMFLKKSPEKAAELLQFIFNFSWEFGVLPSTWKTANVCAIFKPGNIDRSNKANYRPISLTSVVCKLLESLILQRLWKLVGARINRLQFGFRNGCSTLDALLRLQHQIYSAFERRDHLSVCFLDISKAFDRTWHDGLLHKLAQIGVTGNAWRWCRAFLSDRKIRVVHDGQASDWFYINAGVPQGSVLSPFLFLVYINDVFDLCGDRAEMILFADDIAVVPTQAGARGDDKLVLIFYRLDEWSKLWRLDFNAKKSKLLCFSNKKKKPRPRPQLLNLEFLEQVRTFDYLGLRWQENCQWHQHFEKVMTSAKRVRYLISSVISRDHPPLNVVKHLCHALVRTKFSYGMPVWFPNSERAWRQMDSVITGPIRHCLRLPKSTFLQSVLVETNSLSMRLQYEMLTIRTIQRAKLLPVSESTRQIVDEQANRRIQVKRRAPLVPKAKEFAQARGIELEKAPEGKLLHRWFVFQQRLEWRNSGMGRLLRRLTHDAADQRNPRLLLPRYLLYDTPRVAAVRAKLRFDRSNLKDTLSRQQIIPVGGDVSCALCHYRLKETLDHLLFSCAAFKFARDAFKMRAKRLRLNIKRVLCRRWLLGDLSRVPPRLHVCALELSAEFIQEVDHVRAL